jgi:hypothetical protein
VRARVRNSTRSSTSILNLYTIFHLTIFHLNPYLNSRHNLPPRSAICAGPCTADRAAPRLRTGAQCLPKADRVPDHVVGVGSAVFAIAAAAGACTTQEGAAGAAGAAGATGAAGAAGAGGGWVILVSQKRETEDGTRDWVAPCVLMGSKC